MKNRFNASTLEKLPKQVNFKIADCKEDEIGSKCRKGCNLHEARGGITAAAITVYTELTPEPCCISV